eukprot:9476489-Pyramimonas_sp.AAC.1
MVDLWTARLSHAWFLGITKQAAWLAAIASAVLMYCTHKAASIMWSMAEELPSLRQDRSLFQLSFVVGQSVTPIPPLPVETWSIQTSML